MAADLSIRTILIKATIRTPHDEGSGVNEFKRRTAFMTNVPQKAILDFYSSQGVMTSFEKYEKVIKKLPKTYRRLRQLFKDWLFMSMQRNRFMA